MWGIKRKGIVNTLILILGAGPRALFHGRGPFPHQTIETHIFYDLVLMMML
jgi:hypothetical protein